MAKTRRTASPTDFIVVGAILSLIGGFLVSEEPAFITYLIFGVGAVVLQVGIIAKGVQVGNRSS